MALIQPGMWVSSLHPPPKGRSQSPTPVSGPFCESNVITDGNGPSPFIWTGAELAGLLDFPGARWEAAWVILFLSSPFNQNGIKVRPLRSRGWAGVDGADGADGGRSPASSLPLLGLLPLLGHLFFPLSPAPRLSFEGCVRCHFLQEAASESPISVPQTTLNFPVSHTFRLVW